MPYTEEGKALMLWHLSQAITHMSLHAGRPSQGGELPPGVYERKLVDMTPPNDGVVQSVRIVEFDVPKDFEVSHVGFWTDARAGTLLAWASIGDPIVFKTRGVLGIDLATLDLELEETQ